MAKVVGIDPGIHKGQSSATVCIVDYPSIITNEHLTDFNEVCKSCAGAELVIIERPDAGCGFGPNKAGNLLRCANLASDLSIVLYRKWGCQNVLLTSAEVIREFTCSYTKGTRTKADPFIKNWLKNFHFRAERQESRPELFKPKGALSTDHKRDAYLAAWLAEMMLKNAFTKSRVEARST